MFNFRVWYDAQLKKIEDNGLEKESICREADCHSQTLRDWEQKIPNTAALMERLERTINRQIKNKKRRNR